MVTQRSLKSVKNTAGNSWGTDPSWSADPDGEYDVDKFYVRATNKFNHSSKARLNLPPDTMSMLADTAERIPFYRNAHDLIRDAIHHRIQHLSAVGWTTPQMEQWLQVERASAVVEQARMETEALTQLVDDASFTIAELERTGDRRKLRIVLEQLELTADGLGDPWSGKLHELVKRGRR